MKIAFIYDTAYPWVTGGAEKRIYEIGTRLAKRGHDVHIFSLGFWKETKEYENKEIIEYDGMTLHSVGNPIDLYTEDNTRSIKEALYFAKCILTNTNFDDFDIVDCQGFPYFSCFSSKIKTRSNKPNLVITLHEVWNDYWYEYLGKKGFFGKIIEKRVLHLTENIICVSELTRENMTKNHYPLNNIIIPNGVNTQEIMYTNPDGKYCDILFAGRLIPEKNLELLIKSLDKVVKVHPFIKCSIIGNGPMEQELRKLIWNLHLEKNIHIQDFYKDQKDLYSKMKSSLIFILPSKREGFGIVAIEANACGIPVITLDEPMNATKSLIDGKNGWITNDNSDDLSELINQIMENPITSDQRNYCRKFAKKYDWDYITSMIEDYYFNIIYNK